MLLSFPPDTFAHSRIRHILISVYRKLRSAATSWLLMASCLYQIHEYIVGMVQKLTMISDAHNLVSRKQMTKQGSNTDGH